MLSFCHRTQHAVCATCFEFKAKIRHAKSLKMQVKWQLEYMSHLQDQYADRQIYWALRDRAIGSGDLITIIHDGMDKSKFRMPRWSGSRMNSARSLSAEKNQSGSAPSATRRQPGRTLHVQHISGAAPFSLPAFEFRAPMFRYESLVSE